MIGIDCGHPMVFAFLFVTSIFILSLGVYVHLKISKDYLMSANRFRRRTVKPYCLRITRGIIISAFTMLCLSSYWFYDFHLHFCFVFSSVFVAMVFITFFQSLILSLRVIRYSRKHRSMDENAIGGDNGNDCGGNESTIEVIT